MRISTDKTKRRGTGGEAGKKRKVKSLGKVVAKHHAMKVYWRSGSIAPLIL
jgi:hypothetical protein